MGAAAASEAHRALLARGASLATAESLTGGLIGAALTDIAGASTVYRGGVVAYATDLKAELLGVPRALLAEHGAVHPDVALHMAQGVKGTLAATFGLAVTGVAGPEPQDGSPAGTVHIAVAGPGPLARVEELRLTGDRGAIRAGTVDMALRLLSAAVDSGNAA